LEEISVTAIVLNSLNYKEKDKIIHLFSLELGNISAILKSVSSPNAKLKFAGQPFCFAKFDLVKKGEFYVVKSADLIDTFFDLTIDYENYVFSMSMLEILNYVLKPGIISEGLFIALLKTLKNIVYNGINVKLALLKFYIYLLELTGYKLNFITCDNCGLKFMGGIKFNAESGTFRCRSCSGGELVDQQVFMSLKIIDGTDFDRLNTLKLNDDCLSSAIRLVINNVSKRLNYVFKSFKDVNLV